VPRNRLVRENPRIFSYYLPMTTPMLTLSPLLSRALLVLLLTLCPIGSLLAGNLPNWDRIAALQAAAIEDSQQQVHQWLQQINTGQAAEVLDAVQHSPATGTPAFEYQLHSLALFLAEAVPEANADRLLAWLENYPSVVLVAHEESASHGVPLFPVAAAAKGSRVEWQRRTAQQQTGQLMADPQRWIEAYLAASPAGQQGLEQGLRMASPDAVASMAGILQQQLAGHPQLALPAGIVAGSLADEALFLAALQHSQGASTVQILRQANWQLDAVQRSQLFGEILDLSKAGKGADPAAPVANPVAAQVAAQVTALSISLLAPGLHSNPAVSQRLLQLLDDEALGAAAALALAGHPDSKVQASLRGKLQGGGLAAQRAALALDQPATDLLQQPFDGDNQ
jgi:hypothetical protein